MLKFTLEVFEGRTLVKMLSTVSNTVEIGLTELKEKYSMLLNNPINNWTGEKITAYATIALFEKSNESLCSFRFRWDNNSLSNVLDTFLTAIDDETMESIRNN